MTGLLPFVFILFLFSQITASTICESVTTCKCSYGSENDYRGETINCAYSAPSLLHDNTLPTLVYSLNLAWSNLTRLQPSDLLTSQTMIDLHLNNNEIVDIAPNALRLPELRRLDISFNKLEYIDGDAFKSIKKLEYLNVAHNRFTTFTKLTFHHLNSLIEIVLDGNSVGPSLEEMNLFDRNGFGLTHKIKNISMRSINLNIVPDNFFINAYDLRKLNMADNSLTEIFELPFTLEHLDLSDNPIKEISMEDFSDSLSLKELKLNNLHLKEVPDFVFAPLKSLVKLELERNKLLTNFSAVAFGQEVLGDPDDFLLEKLSLKGSRLSTLSRRLIQPFGQLIELDLQGNPWKCDCNIVWLKNLQIPPKDYEHLRCATPESLFNSRIFDLDASYFSCLNDKHYVGVTIAIITLCLLLSMIAVWLMFCLPRFQSRCQHIQNIYGPSTAYTVLPLQLN